MFSGKVLTFFAIAPADCEKKFLGLTTWYHYLPSSDFGARGSQGNVLPGTQCDIGHFAIKGGSSDIPLVLVAIVDDLLYIAGLVALAFIFVGAIKFITSEGNSDNAANARSTIINSLAGLAIAITAAVFVNFIGNAIGSK